MKKDKPEVKVGQMWRKNNKLRYVRVDSFAVKRGKPAVWVQPCAYAGWLPEFVMFSHISLVGLQTKFQLIKDV